MKNEELYHFHSLEEFGQRFPNMSKREIEAYAEHQAQLLFDEGELNEFQMLSTAVRMETMASTYGKEVRKRIQEVPEKNYKAFGCEFSTMNTGDRKDYSADPIYADLEKQLKERKELLDLSFKSTQPIYDNHGAEVPKVPIKTFGSTVIKVKF
jgi:hypothetical protein